VSVVGKSFAVLGKAKMINSLCCLACLARL